MDDNTNAVSIADMVFETVWGHAECYAAGVRAADANSPSARKLARLCAVLDDALADNDPDDQITGYWRGRIRGALEEARR